DYSQIELRILASLSGDEKLIAAYRDAKDIHRATAAEVFHTPYDEVTPELRSRAKAVNFGIVYGISSFGLSNDLGIPIKEAEKYIADYFETYPQIKKYLDGLVKSARDTGYAVTGFGRRRPIPELSSSNYMQRQFGDRAAMNSPIQGTAADIIKIAMIHADARLRRELPAAKLVLQVHDELLVETPEELVDEVKKILTEEMRGAADMAVSLEVGIASGHDWYEAH
ncbi:MAG: DNA polymerase I, partial [Lachnospiraceae bacterium]|nr:DNA polymerase I [Lachnospiraceae bacterium]